MQPVTSNGLKYYRSSRWPTLKHGIFTRHGGVSRAPFNWLNLGGNVGDDPVAVRSNHEAMYATLGVSDAHACTVWQVHSNDVLIAQHPVRGRRWLAYADGMITDRPGISLSMRFADCTPLLFFDPTVGAIGLAHAGWRGTVAGIAGNTVRALMTAYGCKPGNIQVVIGPSIGPKDYQVGEEVVAAVKAHFGSTDGLIYRHSEDGSAYFDLWEANTLDVRRVGVEQVEIAGLSTAEHTGDFFSHRAERGHTGRFGAVMCL